MDEVWVFASSYAVTTIKKPQESQEPRYERGRENCMKYDRLVIKDK